MPSSPETILVVSDLHLGGERGAAASADICHLLDWIHKSGDSFTVSSLDRENWRLRRPSLIVLLGDLVDLWVPRSRYRSSVLEDLIPVLERLHAMEIEVVYVTGNHDHELDELSSFYPGGKVPFTIISRHYPPAALEKGEKVFYGLPVGANHYFFMHGHQFDKAFNGISILHEYPGWVSNLESIFLDHPAVPATAQSIIGLTFLFFMITFFSNTEVPYLSTFLAFVAGIALVIYLMSLPTHYFKEIWTVLQDKLKKTAVGKGVYSLIDEEHWSENRGKNIRADTIIFGHTHVPEDTKDRFSELIGKRFVNCGSWDPVPPPHFPPDLPYFYDTFVYIDDRGPVLLWWNEEESSIYELAPPREAEPDKVSEINRTIKRYFYSVK